jgi:MFS family permease
MSAPVAAEPRTFSAGYLRYALGLLTVVYVVNFVDRQILAILLESIKQEFGLSDFELGLLGGTAFGLFYATMGVPIARLADVYSRKWVMAICLTIWSAMTALCGATVGFWSLLLMRVGVGIGEAGGSPPAHSMISDYFPPDRRATALGVFSLGVPLGILVGFMTGGVLNDTIGWRWTFAAVGLPGVVLALVVAFTLHEPRRGQSEATATTGGQAAAPSASETARFLWRSRSFRHAAMGSALYAFVGYSVTNWAPPFLMRSHGLSGTEVGTSLALIIGIGGGVGIYLGGRLSDRLSTDDARYRMWVPAAAVSLALPFGFVVFTTESTALALAMLVPPTLLGLMYQAPALALVQSLATPSMRATAGAILLLVINIIGLAMGPAVTGLVSDLLEPRFADDALRYAMLIVSLAYGWSGLHFYLASRTVRDDLAFAEGAMVREARGESIWG